jgi:Integrase zinc binding domain/Integrase core domain
MDLTLYQQIYNYLDNQIFPVPQSPRERRQFLNKVKHFQVYNGQLFKKPRKSNQLLIKVIRRDEMEPLLFMMHNHPTSGHLGIESTYNRIKDKYYWNQMFEDIKEYIRSCDSCQRFGRPKRTEPLHTIPVGQPFERVGIDIVGPLPVTSRGNRYIVVATDYLTKWPEAKPLSNATAEAVAQFIYDDIICRHGAPTFLLSDQGTHFKNKLISELCDKFNMDHRFSSPYHPQTNGLVERLNQTLENALRKIRDPMNWDNYVSSILFAYRTNKQSTTKYTPFFLNYGRDARLPIEVDGQQEMMEYNLENTVLQRAYELVDQLPLHHQKARDSIQQSQKLQERRHLKKIPQIIKYKEGDKVLMYDSRLDKQWSGKLDTKWKGPFVIHKCLDKGTYALKNQFGPALKELVHADRLKLYKDRSTWEPQIVIDNLV